MSLNTSINYSNIRQFRFKHLCNLGKENINILVILEVLKKLITIENIIRT